MKTTSTLAGIARWLARLSAGLLCLFWGAFFVEHLQEWFLSGNGALPPVHVWIGQLLHFVMIAGLAMVFFWPRLGSVVAIAGTVLFFAWIGVKEFPWIALLNLLPPAFASVSWWLQMRTAAESGAASHGGRSAL